MAARKKKTLSTKQKGLKFVSDISRIAKSESTAAKVVPANQQRPKQKKPMLGFDRRARNRMKRFEAEKAAAKKKKPRKR
jgi:hypothetical protein